MGSSGAALVQIAATIGGSFFGPIGAAVGNIFGGAIGRELFPPDPIRGPRLNDLRVNNSQLGAPVPRTYGNGRVAGSLIWLGEVREREVRRSEGGLFGIGGQDVINYEYYATFAIAINDGEIGDVRKIWANSKLIYNAGGLTDDQKTKLEEYLAESSSGTWGDVLNRLAGAEYRASLMAAERFEQQVLTIYRGTEDQDPDPVIQSYLGAADTPAYRGTAYIVLSDWNITEWGGALPNIECEIVNGPPSALMGPEFRNSHLEPWVTGTDDPRNCLNDHQYRYDPPGRAPAYPWRATLAEALTDAGDYHSYDFSGTEPHGWSATSPSLVSPYSDVSTAERETLTLHINPLRSLINGRDYSHLPVGSCGGSGCCIKYPSGDLIPPGAGYFWWDGVYKSGTILYISRGAGVWSFSAGLGGGLYDPPKITDLAWSDAETAGNNCTDYTPSAGIASVVDLHVQIRRAAKCPWNECNSPCFDAKPLLPDDPRFCVDPSNGEIYYAGDYLRYESGTSWAILCDYTTLDPYPLGYYEEPAVPDSDSRYPGGADADEFWPRIYTDAVQRGIVPSGWTYGVEYPVTVSSPNFRVLQAYDATGGTINRYPLDPCVPQWSQRYDDSSWWDARYALQLDRYAASGEVADYMPSGLSYGAGYPVTQTWTCARFPPAIPIKSAQQITLAEIVSDICDTCGLAAAQYDVTALTKTLWGYQRTTTMTGRDAIEQLRTYGFFDAVESGPVLRFVPRGGAAVATLAADDLGAYVDGDQAPPAITPTRTEPLELPREVRVNYLEFAAAYQGNTQYERRTAAGAENISEVSLNVAADADVMQQVAQSLLYDAWAARNRYVTTVTREWLALEPTDPVNVPVDGQLVRMRIESINDDPRGVRTLNLTREDATAYISTATGHALPIDDDITPLDGPTQLVVIDGPALDASDDDAGVYVAARGPLSGWPGGGLYASGDGGTTFEFVVSLPGSAQIGTAVNALPSASHYVWDRTSTLTVDVPQSVTLQSVTELAVLNGANFAFVGASGRWELLQFATVTLVSAETDDGLKRYALTDLLRGRRGTEWAVGLHSAGDTAVIVDSTVQRLTLDESAIGLPLTLMAVTQGASLDDGLQTAVTPAAVALECYAPVLIDGVRDPGGDIAITWVPRSRAAGDRRDWVDLPLNESSERYELDVIGTDGVTVIRTLSSTTPAVTYTAAQITADFGTAPASITVRVYQLSLAAGRGYAGSGAV